MEALSVKERIERELVATLVRELEVDARHVQRWDQSGNDVVPNNDGSLPEAWLLITPADEDVAEGGGDEAAIGTSESILPITIDCHLLKPAEAAETTSEYGNRWLARLRAAVKSNPHLFEGGPPPDGEQYLAIDTQIVGTFGPASGDGARDVLVGLELEIHYRTPEADPYTVG